jgi:hypothetical protein
MDRGDGGIASSPWLPSRITLMRAARSFKKFEVRFLAQDARKSNLRWGPSGEYILILSFRFGSLAGLEDALPDIHHFLLIRSFWLFITSFSGIIDGHIGRQPAAKLLVYELFRLSLKKAVNIWPLASRLESSILLDFRIE